MPSSMPPRARPTHGEWNTRFCSTNFTEFPNYPKRVTLLDVNRHKTNEERTLLVIRSFSIIALNMLRTVHT